MPGPANLLLLVSIFTTIVHSQQAPAWRDPSPHTTRFVSVDKDVQLEVLDWGGSGRTPVLLLAGGGDTAHVFDDSAPKLTRDFRVYGVTRRGFGESGYKATQSAADQLKNDLLAVLDALKLHRPVLVGHSIAGEEMSAVANAHSDRVAGLVYLEAAYPYAFDDGHVPSMNEFQSLNAPQPPGPVGPDLASFPALQRYYSRVLGFTYPEGELRQQWVCKPDGSVGDHRDFPGYAILMAAITDYPKYSTIPVPTLAIFAIPHGQGKWVDSSTDPKVNEAARAYAAALTPLTERQVNAFKKGAPRARVIRLRGAHHYVYLSNEAEVLRALRGFLTGLH